MQYEVYHWGNFLHYVKMNLGITQLSHCQTEVCTHVAITLAYKTLLDVKALGFEALK